MSERIGIAELLRASTRPRGSEDDMFCAKHTPALIEALVAAYRLTVAADRNPIPLVAEQPFCWDDLTRSLDRFDFGDEA